MFSSDLISVQGVSKVKKVFKLVRHFTQDGQIIDKPHYDSRFVFRFPLH